MHFVVQLLSIPIMVHALRIAPMEHISIIQISIAKHVTHYVKPVR
jgi:hypothetical protein